VTESHKEFPWPSEDELQLLRHFCQTDFWTFFNAGFGAGINPRGEFWIEPEVHKPLADWFQGHVLEWLAKRKHGRGEQKHLAVVVHREVGKTTLITQAGSNWLQLLDPELSIYIGSERSELSAKMLGGIKAVLDGSDPYSLFTKLYGNWSTGARTWTGKEIVHIGRKNTSKKDPSFGTFAVETSIVGAHPDAIFYDDPISYERLVSDKNWLQTVNGQLTSLFPVIQSDGLVVMVGTRYDDDDHFGIAFRDEGVKTLTGSPTDSITTDPDGKWHVYFLAGRDQENRPTTPKVWPEKRLADYQRRDPLRYAAQVMNDPAVSEFNPITKDQIRQCLIDAKDVPWHALRYAITCDLALDDGSKRVGKDETVFIVHGYPRNGSGDVYVIEGYGSPMWRAEEFGARIVALVQRYRKQGRHIFAITNEVAMAGLKDVWKLALQNMFHDVNIPMPNYQQFSRGGTRKPQRLVAAASFWVDGHVKVVQGSPGSDRLMEQMARIGQYMVNQRLKIDWADAHADAFQPELYQPMRRFSQQKAPYDRGATPFEVEGLSQRLFEDDEVSQWMDEVPREPIR
jgi:hypothetical protein